jgi:hypothetical protein
MRVAPILGAAAWMLLLPAALHSQAAPSDNAYIRRAQLGAPRSISAEAAIARIEKDGKVTSIRDGKNGFTCGTIPDGGNSPVCADQAGWDFLVSAFSGQDKPKSDKPGIAYMMQGGRHWETRSGEIVMSPGNGTRMAKEPPHWMLLHPFQPEESGLPTHPDPQGRGTYIMFAGTPFAHLMVYQNPATMKLRPTADEKKD